VIVETMGLLGETLSLYGGPAQPLTRRFIAVLLVEVPEIASDATRRQPSVRFKT